MEDLMVVGVVLVLEDLVLEFVVEVELLLD